MFLKWIPCWLGLSHVNTNFVDFAPVSGAKATTMARMINVRRFNWTSPNLQNTQD